MSGGSSYQGGMDTKEMILCALFTALITIGTFIKIPVPLVPFTLQFLFTNLAGLLLGKRLGAFSVVVYIALGLAGAPVFTGGGGPGYILQPTFGYILGFLAGTWLAGYLVEKRNDHSLKTFLLAGGANIGIVYLVGLSYYYFLSNYYLGLPIEAGTLLVYGLLLAAPGDIFLCFAGAVFSKRIIAARGGV